MKKLKKIATLLLAMLASLSFGVFTACNEEEPQSSTPPDTFEEDMCQNGRPHSYAMTAEDKNEMATEIGQCTVCGENAVLPTLPTNQNFPTMNATKNNDEFSPLDLTEGCYNLEIPANGEFWICFSSEGAGQFAFYSMGNTTATVTRYTCAYVGIGACYYAADGKMVEDNFYSYVNRSNEEEGEYWRTVFCIKGKANSSIKVCFTRISSPIWEPSTITTVVYPTEIKGVKAPEPSSTQELKAIDYDESYFFDETVGYYRMGTKDIPGEIIYAAITKKAERIFESMSFIDALENFGRNVYLGDGKDEEGNNKVISYIPFLYNCADDNNHNNGEKDLNKNCYMNYCNSDGVYPVTKELYQFLNLYVRSHRPISLTDSAADYAEELSRDWREHKNEDGKDENRNKYWLAGCYYYDNIETGSKENPYKLVEGDNEIATAKYERSYAITPSDGGEYRLVCTDANVKVLVGETLYEGGIDIIIKAGTILRFDLGVNGGTTTVTLTKEIKE